MAALSVGLEVNPAVECQIARLALIRSLASVRTNVDFERVTIIVGRIAAVAFERSIARMAAHVLLQGGTLSERSIT